MDLFLSYASEQRAVAEEVALALRGERHQVFYDRAALPEGEAYNAHIREAIEPCDLLVFLVSPESVSPGRYTLTELQFAADKWPSPAGHVLPVVVQPTESAAIPPYLRSVVMLRPAGSIAAEVAAAVGRIARPRWRTLARRAAAPALAVTLIAAGFVGWHAVEAWRNCEQASGLTAQARLQEAAHDYAAAWNRYADAATLCPSGDDVVQGQARLAMRWLENIRIDPQKESFAAIVDKLQPVLSRAAVAADDSHAADALAHLGWADVLRAREGKQDIDPTGYYQQALSRDPHNVFAHAFWGHYLLTDGGSPAAAQAHFAAALATGLERHFVREMQLSAWLWDHAPDPANEAIRVANDMRAHHETLAGAGSAALVSRLWNEYYDRLVRGHATASFLASLPPEDHLATFVWLFPAYANSNNREPYLFMLAQLQAHSGKRAEALTSLRSLLASTASRGANDGAMVVAARAAVQRLQSR